MSDGLLAVLASLCAAVIVRLGMLGETGHRIERVQRTFADVTD